MEITKEEKEALVEYFKTKDTYSYEEYATLPSAFATIENVRYIIDRTGTALKVEFSGKSIDGGWNEYAKVKIPLVDFIVFCSQYNK